MDNTKYRFPSEKYIAGENLSLVENTRNWKVISVNYNFHFDQEKVHDTQLVLKTNSWFPSAKCKVLSSGEYTKPEKNLV